MQEQLLKILSAWSNTMTLIVVFALVFSVLSRYWPCNPDQRKPTIREVIVDACYYFLVPLFNRYLHICIMAALATGLVALYGGDMESYLSEGYGPLRELPMWLQIILVLLVQDLYMYWMHRTLHRMPLWRYHVIHHAPEALFWHSTVRFHPVNTLLSFTFADALAIALGFSPQAILLMANVNAFWSAFVHANLRWDFGPLRYVIASPVFHRWHHTAPKFGGMKNFAPTFPFIDLMFGTFYMPKGRLPDAYGVHEAVPASFWGQMVHPFRKRVDAAATNGNDGK